MSDESEEKGREVQDGEKAEKQKPAVEPSPKMKPVSVKPAEESEFGTTPIGEFTEPQMAGVPEPPVPARPSGFRFTIAKKLGVGFGLALIILVVIGAVSLYSINTIMRNVDLVNHTNEVLRKLSLLEISLLNAQRGMRGFVVTGDERFLDSYQEALNTHTDLFRDLKDSVRNEDQDRELEAMRASIEAEFDALQEVVDVRRTQAPEIAIELVKTDKAKKPMDEFLKAMDQMRTKEQRLSVKFSKDQKTAEATAKVTIVFGTLFAFVLLSFAGGFITLGITGNLKKVVDGLDKSALTGDLTQTVSLQTTDELNTLAGAFNTIQRTFHSIVSRIANASLKIISTSNELLAAANQQESSTQEQSSQISQIQSTLNQFASSAIEVSQTTKELSKLVEETSKESQHGTALIKDVNEKMKSIGNSNQSVAGKLKTLNDNIEGIGKMLSVILSVADQTNLLSLNAAIEAAKAGEHGRGFSVVAQEIRRLADQTAQSSKEISYLINEIQASSSGVLMAMEKSSQDITGGVDIVENMGTRFLAISERVQNVANQFDTIVTSMQEQASGQKEISSTMVQMVAALKLTASSAQQVSKSAYDLTAMGHQLRSAVGQFKLK